ncbi:hypothetical protein FA15DRAFT_703297 [Coprinopsis marcescibilis]|uniref:DUF6533 domain-containing protein n=1 Tax=Coprinopsis marcescibilis TaxID=230819 RepID=A0A5C3LBZ2_COPMA|nr:hypothetical protein FA15DRAFT_703297 [Coprinopsis marcescibilis]
MDNEPPLELMVWATRLIYSSDLACLMLWVADYLETLPLEVSLMWPPKMTPVNTLFFVLRYLPPIQFILSIALSVAAHYSPLSLCPARSTLVIVLITLGVLTSEGLLFLRVYAIAGSTKFLKIFLIVLGLSTGVPILFFVVKYQTGVEILDPPNEYIRCFQKTSNAKILAAVWGIVLGNEVLMMIMTCLAGYLRYRNSTSPLLEIFYKNGTAYFVAIAFVSGANIMASFLAQQHLYLTSTLQHTLHAIFATRMILHIRKTTHVNVTYAEPEYPLETLKWRQGSQSARDPMTTDHSSLTQV